MQKFTSFLEDNVQWVALGLGAVFLLWMLVFYLLRPPVTVPLGQRELAPGEVDKHIARGATQRLEAAMEGGRPPEIELRQFSREIIAALRDGEDRPLELAGKPWTFSQTGMIDVPIMRDEEEFVLGEGEEAVSSLPELPAPELSEMNVGRSVVVLHDVNRQDQEPAGRQLREGVGQRPNMVQRDPMRQAAFNTVDRDWVTVAFRIPMRPIAEAFQRSSIPDPLFRTQVLRVELVRQEQLADGTWGNETIVPPLRGLDVPPLPAADDAPAQYGYVDWAITNSHLILQPPFYEVVDGQPWLVPVQDDQMQMEQMFNPYDYLTIPIPDTLTPEQRQQVMDARREDARLRVEEQRQQRQQQQPGQRQRQRPGRDGYEMDYMDMPMEGTGRQPRGRQQRYNVADPERSTPFLQTRQQRQPPQQRQQRQPARPTRGMPPGGYYDDMMMYEMEMMDMMEPGMGYESGHPMGPGTAPPIPTGRFEPDMVDDIEGWAHDDTAEPGKTYRYKIRYLIENPIFGHRNLAEPPELADRLFLPSPESEWTEPVTIQPWTDFYIASGLSPGGNTVRFDIFKWQDGSWQRKSVPVGPGDLIAVNDGEVDFITDWTVVDLRTDRRTGQTHVLLMDREGNLVRRDFNTDQNNPRYRELREEVAAATTTGDTPGQLWGRQ